MPPTSSSSLFAPPSPAPHAVDRRSPNLNPAASAPPPTPNHRCFHPHFLPTTTPREKLLPSTPPSSILCSLPEDDEISIPFSPAPTSLSLKVSLIFGSSSVLLHAVADHRNIFWNACIRGPVPPTLPPTSATAASTTTSPPPPSPFLFRLPAPAASHCDCIWTILSKDCKIVPSKMPLQRSASRASGVSKNLNF